MNRDVVSVESMVDDDRIDTIIVESSRFRMLMN